jgi:DNA-binding transcriptional LysR family regulator
VNRQHLHGSLKPSFTITGALLAQLPTLVAVADHRSFTAAARALGVSTSAVSQTIARLEASIGAPLVVRTTRSVNLTDAGTRLVGELRPALAATTAAVLATRERRRTLTGTLRLNIPRLALPLVTGRLVPAYLRAHPEITVEVTVEDRNADIVAEGFDAGVRLHEAVERDMISLPLTRSIRFVVVGAPSYLAARGTPTRPRDLGDHACLGWRSMTSGRLYAWELEHRGRTIEVAVTGPVITNDIDVIRDLACAGFGLAYVSEGQVAADVAAKRLVRVLDAYLPPIAGLYLYYPRAARTVPTLAAFVACAKAISAG